MNLKTLAHTMHSLYLSYVTQVRGVHAESCTLKCVSTTETNTRGSYARREQNGNERQHSERARTRHYRIAHKNHRHALHWENVTGAPTRKSPNRDGATCAQSLTHARTTLF